MERNDEPPRDISMLLTLDVVLFKSAHKHDECNKPMKRSFVTLGFFSLALMLAASFVQAQEKPNIVFILADDLGYRDLDGSLTKAWMMSQRGSPRNKELFSLTMDLRPSEELYDLNNDPDQLVNLAADSQQTSILKTLRGRVVKVMNDTNDPRLTDTFDQLPWVDSTKP